MIAGRDQPIFTNLYAVFMSTDTINLGLLFRFVRVQVQLKASEENSLKILKAIKRSKWMEYFVYVDLLIF